MLIFAARHWKHTQQKICWPPRIHYEDSLLKTEDLHHCLHTVSYVLMQLRGGPSLLCPLFALCAHCVHSLPGHLLRWYRPIHPWRGVALPATLLQLWLHLSGEGGMEAAKTHSLSWHPAEEVRNKEKEIDTGFFLKIIGEKKKRNAF